MKPIYIFLLSILLGAVLALFVEWRKSKNLWYVQYRDGERSCPMNFSTAVDYRKIFGGTIKKESK